MSWSRSNHKLLLRYAGLFTYLCVGIPLLRVDLGLAHASMFDHGHLGLLAWNGSYLVFGVVYWLLTRNLGSLRYWGLKLFGLMVLTAAAVVVGWFSQSGLTAMLTVVIALVLPWLLPLSLGWAWVVLQNVILVPFIASYPGWGIITAIWQVGVYFGISAPVFVISMIAGKQAEEREHQRRLNSELRATRALLAESSRIAERMRISRELHDLVGHHLTALSLNLEVASHLAQPPAAEHVRKAQATAKQLLADVREVVSELRQDAELDLTQALTSLIEGVPSLRVHLDVPPRFAVEDPRRAQVVLRCVQEILTNAVRHAGARNLWLSIRRTPEGELSLEARDDGRGAAQLNPGNGLTGMRERLGEFGGRLDVSTAERRGFSLHAWLPLEPEVGIAAGRGAHLPPASAA